MQNVWKQFANDPNLQLRVSIKVGRELIAGAGLPCGQRGEGVPSPAGAPVGAFPTGEFPSLAWPRAHYSAPGKALPGPCPGPACTVAPRRPPPRLFIILLISSGPLHLHLALRLAVQAGHRASPSLVSLCGRAFSVYSACSVISPLSHPSCSVQGEGYRV
jgi:hypothetical protein